MKHSTVSTVGQLKLNRQSVVSHLSWSQSQGQYVPGAGAPLLREFNPQEDNWEFVKVMESKIEEALKRSRSRIGLHELSTEHVQDKARLRYSQEGQSRSSQERIAAGERIGIWMPALTLVTPEKDHLSYPEADKTTPLPSHQPAQSPMTKPFSHPEARNQQVQYSQNPYPKSHKQDAEANVLILGSPVSPDQCEVPPRQDDPIAAGRNTPFSQIRGQVGTQLRSSDHQAKMGGSTQTPQTDQGRSGGHPRPHRVLDQRPGHIQGGQSTDSLISAHNQGLAFRGLANDISKRNHFVASHSDLQAVYAYELNSNFLEEVWSLRFVSSQELRVLIADSVVFVGDKKNGVKCGKGKYLTQRGGRILYEGFFYDNLYHGEGKLTNPKVPSGPVRQDWWQNLDVLEHWQRFDGHFSGGYPEGFGTLFISNGDTVSGVFLRGRLNGGATIRFANNPSREVFGEWLDNMLSSDLQ